MFKKKQLESTATSESNDEVITSSPLLNSPISPSQNHFAGFFQKESIVNDDLSLEVFKLNLHNEVEQLKFYLSQNNFKNIQEINSTASFWIRNVTKYPLLSKLARILLNIKSSSSCIERYFSICGFSSKKQSSNIGSDLFISRCLLRANIEILRELNEITY